MKTVQFSNGDKMPILGLGTWQSNGNDVYLAIKEAIKLGYRHIDCAFIYQNEAEIGRALAEIFAEGIVRREDLWITSKLWNNSHAPEDVLPAIKKTLADLQLDYLDLYLIHWAIASKVVAVSSGADFIPLEKMPISETWKSMEKLVHEGLTKHIGVSNFSTKKLQELLKTAQIRPEMNQIEMHPYLQQPKMLQFCQENNIHLTAYSPLGRPQKAKKGDEFALLENPIITEIAKKYEVSSAQIVLSWAIHRNTSVIPKSVRASRLAENLKASEIILTEEEMTKIKQIDKHWRYVDGKFWELDGSPYNLANIWDE